MTTRIQDIIADARESLGDLSSSRWSDTQLLAYVDEAQKEIAKETHMLKDIITVPLLQAQHTYRLPEDTVMVFRTIFAGDKIPMKTTDWMDNAGITGRVISGIAGELTNRRPSVSNSDGSHWLTATTEGDISCVVYDKLNRRKLRVWPTPIADDLETVETSLDTTVGATHDISDYDALSLYGIITDILDTDQDFISLTPDEFGVVVEIVTQEALVVHRSHLPVTLTALTNDLELDEICDQAIEHYVVGNAFRDDTIVENRAKGGEELQLYRGELDDLKVLASKNSVSDSHHDSRYNGMG